MITFASPNLSVHLDGLEPGKTDFVWKLGKSFFESFGNTEISDAEVSVEASVEKSGRYIGVDCQIGGSVTVACDRCLDDLVLPVDTAARLSVKFGEAPSASDEIREGEREVLYLSSADADLDLAQVVYDYVCLSLPVQRVHPDGACNPDVVRYLSHGEEEAPDADAQSPFAALKALLKDDR